MSLAPQSFSSLGISTGGLNSLAHEHCEKAKEFEEAGDYESAAECLGDFWRGIGARPVVDGLEQQAAAEMLLRAGVLTGWLGSAGQVEGSQESAKNLISESAAIFDRACEWTKVAEARISLAVCYWREGSLDEARVVIKEVLSQIGGRDAEQEARAYLCLAIVERRATRYDEALNILTDAAPLFDAIPSHAHKGRFHNQLATVLENLGRAESRADYIDRALVEYTAASFHFEQAGHAAFRASVENNLGFLFFAIGRHAEAHEHLARARRLFELVGDRGHVAQVEDTLARVLLAEGKSEKAEGIARSAVRRLENGGELSLLAEALTTHGRALARLERGDEAEAALRRAVEVAQQTGDLEGAGLAALTLFDEIGERLPAREMRAIYEHADDLLSRTQDTEVLARLRRCARKLISSNDGKAREAVATQFVHAAAETVDVLRRARLIARAEGPVLLTGETGTGKEALARMIHDWSGRAGKFVTIHCAGLSEELFELKLFGRRGADASNGFGSQGAVGLAHGGTLFFDEVGVLSPAVQAALLRLVEWFEVRRGADPGFRGNDVRVIASTNDDLRRLVEEGHFRGDLFYRLQNFHVTIPPLRERPADIPALAAHFIEGANAGRQQPVAFTGEAVRAMSLLPLKGNARELKSLIERTVLTADEGAVVTAEMIELAALRNGSSEDLTDHWEGFSLKDEIHRIERRFIDLALRETNGKVSHAARLLGFRHHESLASLLKSRHQELLPARTPARTRRRSIIRQTRHSAPKV